MKKGLKILLITVGALIGIAVIGAVGVYLYIHESLPEGTEGEAAEALATNMREAINHSAWEKTGAIQWTFAGARHHVWDRKRNFARVQWEGNDVIINTQEKTGKVLKEGKAIPHEELIGKAWEVWVNDSFWLNPVSKIFDDGTSRKIVEMEDGNKALLITYSSGGATPGDSYLWILDENNLPKAWKLWVSIIPWGGLEFSWEEWQTLETGVKVSTKHHSFVRDVNLSDIKAAENLSDLMEEDPFAELQ